MLKGWFQHITVYYYNMFLLNSQLTWPSLSLMTMSTGVSWPCMALYSVLMLMPCFDVPKANVHGYPMVRGGRFLASCEKNNNEKGRMEEGKKEKGNEKQKGHSHQCSITSAVTF